jgi:hypothetical protein
VSQLFESREEPLKLVVEDRATVPVTLAAEASVVPAAAARVLTHERTAASVVAACTQHARSIEGQVTCPWPDRRT